MRAQELVRHYLMVSALQVSLWDQGHLVLHGMEECRGVLCSHMQITTNGIWTEVFILKTTNLVKDHYIKWIKNILFHHSFYVNYIKQQRNKN